MRKSCSRRYMFLNLYSQLNSVGRRNWYWKAAFDPGAWISGHFHSSRLQKLNKALDTNDFNWWRVLIFLPQELQTLSDLSSARNILLAIKTLSHVQLCDNHIKRASLLWGLKKVLGSNVIPLRTKFDTQTKSTVISHRKRKRFSSSAGLLFRSEFSDRWHNTGFGYVKSILFLHFPRNVRAGQLGLLSINFDFPNVIFQPMVFPFAKIGKLTWTKW